MSTHINPYSPIFKVSPHLLYLCICVWCVWGFCLVILFLLNHLSFSQTSLSFTPEYFNKYLLRTKIFSYIVRIPLLLQENLILILLSVIYRSHIQILKMSVIAHFFPPNPGYNQGSSIALSCYVFLNSFSLE